MSHEQLVEVDENNTGGVRAVVSGDWFDSAFDTTFGQGTAAVLEHFYTELYSILCLHETKDNSIAIDEKELMERLHALSCRMGTAADWAKRLEKLAEKSGGA